MHFMKQPPFPFFYCAMWLIEKGKSVEITDQLR